MICEACQGFGWRLNPELAVIETRQSIYIENPAGLPMLVPCSECGASGVAHCCDGLQAQPEEDTC